MALPKYGSKSKNLPVAGAAGAAPTPWAQAGLTPEPQTESVKHHMSDAERCRTIVGNNRLATLSVTVGNGSTAVGFIVPYANDENGMPLLAIRPGIEASGRLRPNLAASLAVAETPLTATTAGVVGGVTLLGEVDPVGGDDIEFAMTEYARTQPVDAALIKRGAGRLYRFNISSLLIATSNDTLESLTVNEYLEASSDPLAAIAPGLLAHLGGDQSGSLVLLSRAFGGQPETTSATLVGIDQYGMDILASTPKGRESVRLNFSQPAATAEDVRRELTVMTRGARFKLGG